MQENMCNWSQQNEYPVIFLTYLNILNLTHIQLTDVPQFNVKKDPLVGDPG